MSGSDCVAFTMSLHLVLEAYYLFISLCSPRTHPAPLPSSPLAHTPNTPNTFQVEQELAANRRRARAAEAKQKQTFKSFFDR